MKKIILLILDGLGDRPLDSLGGKTPLQAARSRETLPSGVTLLRWMIK